MKEQEQHAPRTDPAGRYKRVCPVCGTPFRTNNPRSVYDTERCKAHAAFARYYRKYRAKVIAAVIARRKQ